MSRARCRPPSPSAAAGASDCRGLEHAPAPDKIVTIGFNGEFDHGKPPLGGLTRVCRALPAEQVADCRVSHLGLADALADAGRTFLKPPHYGGTDMFPATTSSRSSA